METSYFRKNYTGFVATVLKFCEQNNIKLNIENIFKLMMHNYISFTLKQRFFIFNIINYS